MQEDLRLKFCLLSKILSPSALSCAEPIPAVHTMPPAVSFYPLEEVFEGRLGKLRDQCAQAGNGCAAVEVFYEFSFSQENSCCFTLYQCLAAPSSGAQPLTAQNMSQAPVASVTTGVLARRDWGRACHFTIILVADGDNKVAEPLGGTVLGTLTAHLSCNNPTATQLSHLRFPTLLNVMQSEDFTTWEKKELSTFTSHDDLAFLPKIRIHPAFGAAAIVHCSSSIITELLQRCETVMATYNNVIAGVVPSGSQLRFKFQLTPLHTTSPLNTMPQQLSCTLPPTRTIVERLHLQTQRNLPVFSYREQICQRLVKEGCLVVSSPGGAGKSTQIPQYLADDPTLGQGVIVCTNPCHLALKLLSRQVTSEFEGIQGTKGSMVSLGNDVILNTCKILFMSEMGFIAAAKNDPMLSGVSVLIVDEAQQRTVYTDLVLSIGLSCWKNTARQGQLRLLACTSSLHSQSLCSYLGCSRPVEIVMPGHPHSVETLFYPPILSKNPNKFATQVLEVTLNQVQQIPTGNTLVFLPGTLEIALARKFLRNAKVDFSSRELHEEAKAADITQFGHGNIRHIIFCTEAAESIFTVPNVTLVIDSGLNQSNICRQESHLTVRQVTRISRGSSAERMKRASLRYIGLYGSQEMLPAFGLPEISHANLDGIILQIISLGFDPCTIPLPTKPDPVQVDRSLAFLTQLGCISKAPDKASKYTMMPLGRACSKLGISDLRLAAFVAKAFTKFGQLQMACTIACLLSSPESVFASSILNPHTKSAAAVGHMSDASLFESDITFLCERYCMWEKSGYACHIPTHQERLRKQRSSQCQECMHQSASTLGLNNHVMKYVQFQIAEMCREFRRWIPDPVDTDKRESWLALSLLAPFQDNIGEVLVPTSPERGVSLAISKNRALIHPMSCFLQRSRRNLSQYFVALSVHQEKGLVVSALHPVSMEQLSEVLGNRWSVEHDFPLRMAPVLERPGMSYTTFHHYEKELRESNSMTAVYNNETCCIQVFSSRGDAAIAKQQANEALNKIIEKLLHTDISVAVCSASAIATFSAGLSVVQSKVAGHRCCFTRLPFSTTDEFKGWLDTVVAHESDVVHAKYTVQSRKAQVIFSSAEALETTCASVRKWQKGKRNSDGEGSSSGDEDCVETSSSMEEEVGKELSLKFNRLVASKEEIAQICEISECKLAEAVCLAADCTVLIKHLPGGTTEESLKTMLQDMDVSVRIKTHTNNVWAWLQFRSLNSYNRAKPVLQSLGTWPRVQIQPPESWCRWRIRLDTMTAADVLFGAVKGRSPSCLTNCQGCSRVEVFEPDTYPLKDMCSAISGKLRGEVEWNLKPWRKSMVVRFSGSPGNCAQASRFLSAATQPIVIKAHPVKNPLQFELLKELTESGKLQEWAKALGLKIAKQRRTPRYRRKGRHSRTDEFADTNCVIYGNQVQQGQFMYQLGEYCDEFRTRFLCVRVNTIDLPLFKEGKAGDSFLCSLKKEFEGTCRVSFLYIKATFVLCANTSSVLTACHKALQTGLAAMGVQHLMNPCVKCSNLSDIQLSLCGHFMCVQCFEKEATSSSFPVKCSSCNLPICLDDLQNNLDKTTFVNLCQSSFMESIQHSRDIVRCPNSGCRGILSSNTYSLCGVCNTWACGSCKAVNDPHHLRSSCAMYQELLKDIVPCISPGCKGTLYKSKMYQLCGGCKKSICANCKVSDQELHIKRSCTEFVLALCSFSKCPAGCGMYLKKSDQYQCCTKCGKYVCPSCCIVNDPLHASRGCNAYREAKLNFVSCSANCPGLLEKTAGYQTCKACGREVCPDCKVCNEPMHKGRACQETKQLISNGCCLCPQSGCTGILYPVGPKQCAVCRKFVCPTCKSIEITGIHMGCSCAELAQRKSESAIVELLYSRAEKWAIEQWCPTPPAITNVVRNPGVETNCPAFQLFRKAIALNDCDNSCFFAWHGTPSEEGVVGISHFGWDPQRRRGQAYGPGEYFGITSAVSLGYCGNVKRMIVALISRARSTTVQGFCYVVNNPVDKSSSYCLPVLTVSFGDERSTPRFISVSSPQGILLNNGHSVNQEWVSPFRWFWKTDSNEFEPYRNEVSAVLEELYDAYSCGGPAVVMTRPIMRYVDDRPQEYRIDFLSMKQTNPATGYIRPICRRPQPIAAGSRTTWQYLSDQGLWVPYDPIVQGTIEAAFQVYSSSISSGPASSAPGTLRIHPPGPWEYSISFITGMQTNLSNNQTRPIRRS
ncbi:ATP-dependent helicase HrpB [Pelomyxa schiedti]|nr:ATP-dependent helicase HrpB [Pelomyxa schiedti]